MSQTYAERGTVLIFPPYFPSSYFCPKMNCCNIPVTLIDTTRRVLSSYRLIATIVDLAHPSIKPNEAASPLREFQRVGADDLSLLRF